MKMFGGAGNGTCKSTLNMLKALNLSDWQTVVEGVTVIESLMDEGNSYCGCGSKIKSVSDAATITNMVVTGAGEDEICLEIKTVRSQI